MFAANNDPRDGAMKRKGAFVNEFIFLFLALSLFLIPTIASGATFCVSSATELQTALTKAASNGEDDTIQIVQGTYFGNFVYASTEAYGVTVKGGYTSGCASREVDPANTVLDGNATGNVLVLSCPDHAVEFVVDGLTLQNGNASNNGGGFFAKTYCGGVTLTNSEITENSAESCGAGVYVSGSSITLTNNIITENDNSAGWCGIVYVSAVSPSPTSFIKVTMTNNIVSGKTGVKSGRGVYIDTNKDGEVTLTNNSITGNSAEINNSGGGGIYVNYNFEDLTVTLNNNTITGNSVGKYCSGGGVYVRFSEKVIMSNNTISGNSVGEYSTGGGVSVWASIITLSDNTITGNYGGNSGGGVTTGGTTVTLTNNTITGNSAGNPGGGGVHVRINTEFQTANIYNNIIYNNSANSGADIYINNDGNDDFIPSPINLYNNDFDQSAAGTYIQIPFAIDPSNINSNPLFVGGSDYHLTASSPCINVGNNSAPDLPSTDKDGNPRIIGGIVDLGAYEHLFAPTVTTDAASSVTSTSATLNGTVNPNGASTTVVFDYGNSESYGNNVTATESPLTGGTAQTVSAGLAGLTPGKTYHFRAKATNSEGAGYGSDVSFTTSYTSTIYVSSNGACGDKTPCYSSIQGAINVASTGSVIKIAQGTYSESFVLNEAKSLTLQGGWNSSYDAQTSNTTFIKAPKAPQGSLTLQMLTIRP
ncbi:MAG: right-handed parallel beta-helix repeat-containing protein [Deltaproteobacteria bacterium]|nr:right-handed parallel beta-helix repeat-containing protein [Deltaproteobacteria bacterium]